MKKAIAICLIVSVSVTLLSFKKQKIENRLFGNWKIVGWYDDIPRDINNDGTQSTDLFAQWNGCKKQSILMLSKDYSSKIIYTGEANNSKCQPDFKKGSLFSSESWKIVDENTLEFIGDDYNETYKIIELTSNLLVLKGSGFMTCCDADITYFTGGYLKFIKK